MTVHAPSPSDAGPVHPSGQRRGDRIGACIAWFAIAICVGWVLGASIYSVSARRHLRPIEVFDPAKVPSIELLMTGRTAVGSRIVLTFLQAAQGKKPGSINLNTEANANQVRELAASPLEKLRAAVVLGELGGSAAALAELDQISPASPAYASIAPDIQSLRVIYTRGPGALPEADRQALVRRHGWFGQLAAAFGKPDTDPARRAVLAPATRAAVVAMSFVTIAVIGCVAGLVLAILALIKLVHGRLQSHYVHPNPIPPPVPARMQWSMPPSGMAGGANAPALNPPPGAPGMPLVYFSPPPPPDVEGPVAYACGSFRFTQPQWPSPGTAAAAPPRGGPFVEAFAIYLVGQLFIGVLLRLFVKHPDISWEWVLLAFIPLPILWPRFRGVGKAEWKRAIGWHTGRGAWTEIGCGVAGYLAGLPVVVVGALVAMLLGKLVHANPTHPLEFEFGQGVGPILQAFVLACVWAPIVEETMFRGALFHHLRRFGKGWRWLGSALLVSFIFAAIHPQGWTFIPVLVALGMVLAALREWRGSILTSATAHFIQNCVVVILMAGILG